MTFAVNAGSGMPLRRPHRIRMVYLGYKGGRMPPFIVGQTMSRVIAVMACGFALAACSMSMPSLDFFKSAPATEQLRIESEPPGADARTNQGQACRTPCELTVPAGAELAVTFALNGYQPMTVPVRAEVPGGATYGEQSPPRLQPNPVYAELQPAVPPRPTKKKAPAKKKSPAAKNAAPAPAPAAAPAPAPAQSQATAPDPAAAYPAGYPWPPPPQ